MSNPFSFTDPSTLRIARFLLPDPGRTYEPAEALRVETGPV